MIIKDYEEVLELNNTLIRKYDMLDMSYFDIETTGFDKLEHHIILISLGYFITDSNFHIRQYFAEDIYEEQMILKAFAADISKYSRWCSYNGIAFDEPFITRKLANYKLDCILPTEHIDLFRLIRPYYKKLGLNRCNLKSVEKHLGIDRADKIDGGESIKIYNEYVAIKSYELRETILLHNYEDVLNLPQVFKLIYEIDINPKLVREDCITTKQLKYLKFLLLKNNIDIKLDVSKISKKTAAKLIDAVINGNINSNDLINMMLSSY
jgi:uncharacterized protein YprB with RNaseH-like and TPR domain